MTNQPNKIDDGRTAVRRAEGRLMMHRQKVVDRVASKNVDIVEQSGSGPE